MEYKKSKPCYDQDFYNNIAELVCSHFNNLPKKGKPLSNEWTTLSAIVQTIDDNLVVVSCATGTKCLGKNELSPFGDVVSDSHSEILSRRSFMLYLFDQLKLAQFVSKKSIFTCNNSPLMKLPQFTLKEGINFHLFVSQLPCGDSAIILKDNEDNSEQPKNKIPKLEISRTGAKLQFGPLVFEEIQSVGQCRIKGGKGDPTLSMSCSDKIAKWQILGLQGCLLSNFIPVPIRFSSIIIGAFVPFNELSLERAIYQRFEESLNSFVKSQNELLLLLKDYCLPSFGQAVVNFSNYFESTTTSSSTTRKNPSPSSIIWHLEHPVQVVVNGRKEGVTKKLFGKPSAMVDVCRKNILKLFHDIILSYNNNDDDAKSNTLTYLEAKRMNELYVKCWSILKSNLFNNWTDKPDNLQNFTVL